MLKKIKYSKLKPGSSNFYVYLNVILFGSVLTCLGLLFFILPHSGLSAFEKRTLCPLPQFSLNSLFKGSYIDSLDLFFADNFPFRDRFVAVSFGLAERRGFRSEKAGYHKTAVVIDTIGPIDELIDTVKTDTVIADTVITEEEEDPGKGIFIYDGMAFQFFGGNEYMARSYAAMVNEYDSALRGIADLYCLIIPSQGEFYLPEEYRYMSKSESENINEIYNNLNPGVIGINICPELQTHVDEYLYFNTDHHWTGLGAYYAYLVFCAEAGLIPVPLDSMESRVSNNFVGSLYLLTRDSRLQEKKDSVIYHRVPGTYTTIKLTGENYDILDTTSLYFEYANGSFGYVVYLGGDFPMMRVDTEINNGRKILAIKNSYGNPFVTYLAANYEQVFIVDYRYYEGSLYKLILDNGITDVIILTSVMSANHNWHISRTRKVLYGGQTREQILSGRDSLPDIFRDDTILRELSDSLEVLKDTIK